ncbi:MAG TPA: serine/threonine-protein kinase [Kofleriaceae bacterium]|nr:serine/threonine-protein kinase [Kofleriaceae bacterium]
MRHRTADLEPTAFGGRYTLIRRLAIGGMAEIYLARQAAMAGFEKEVVIKRLRTELADDPRVVEMFLDEAKIGAQLNHPNIVHVYDVDEHGGIPYIAMEYIIGEELNELCRRGIAHDRFLPLEHAVELVRQAAAGMGYFHAKRSTGSGSGTQHAGEPLDIVHLDISPSNLLVTQDGFMKIIDFGIARARGQDQRTDVLPGKLSYMSPEQASREAVDHRSDVFSLGIVLYEITVGKRLFRGPANEVVKKLVGGQIEPPTFVRRNFPPPLESIVMRALEKHPDDRYQTAYDLADDLESFLRDEKLHSGPVRIARYLDMLEIAQGGTRRPELISEAEARRERGEELDFDSQVFDGFAPAEGAPGPDEAAAWEDVDQPEADIAAALHLELAELRALRTPVPTRPSGMAPVRGDGAMPGMVEDEAPATNPLPRMRTEEIYDDTEDGSGARPVAAPAQAVRRAAADRPAPAIGAAFLERKSGSSRLWLALAIVAVVALGLVAYIVLR